jgi:hypothetical protein
MTNERIWYELSGNKMDVGEKIISSGILGIDKNVYPAKGNLATKIYRTAFKKMTKTEGGMFP